MHKRALHNKELLGLKSQQCCSQETLTKGLHPNWYTTQINLLTTLHTYFAQDANLKPKQHIWVAHVFQLIPRCFWMLQMLSGVPHLPLLVIVFIQLFSLIHVFHLPKTSSPSKTDFTPSREPRTCLSSSVCQFMHPWLCICYKIQQKFPSKPHLPDESIHVPKIHSFH